MNFSIKTDCDAIQPINAGCDDLLGKVTTTVLGEVPGVGGLLVGAFEVACL
jgi:hypothetical protein